MKKYTQIPHNWLFIFICLIITSYFGYHTIQGSRGYRRMNQLKEEILLAQQIANDTRQERDSLKAKVRALSAEPLDFDQLEETALRVLNMGNPDDLVVLSSQRAQHKKIDLEIP